MAADRAPVVPLRACPVSADRGRRVATRNGTRRLVRVVRTRAATDNHSARTVDSAALVHRRSTTGFDSAPAGPQCLPLSGLGADPRYSLHWRVPYLVGAGTFSPPKGFLRRGNRHRAYHR